MEDDKIVWVALNSGIYSGTVVYRGSGFLGKGKGFKASRIKLNSHPTLKFVSVNNDQIVDGPDDKTHKTSNN
jgi:predicted short-subunit dehydrogenase-like oxidoreductase (DUF2520 family)